MMAYQLPEKLRGVVPYEPVTGLFQVRADANESFLSPPEWLREELAAAVKHIAFNRYPDNRYDRLRGAFADYCGLKPEMVVAGVGSDELISLIMGWFASPGDPVITVSPDFSMYAFFAQACGVRLITLEKDPSSLTLDADALIAAAREADAKLVIFSNPCNPTSLEASNEEILKIVTELPDCTVVVDEAYMEFGDASILPLAAHYDNLIVLKTCSKAFGMAAIRLGFAVSNSTIACALDAARSPYNINSMTDAVGCVLFSHPAYLEECTAAIKRSRDALYAQMVRLSDCKAEILDIKNTCANFVFLQVADAKQVFQALASRGIAVRLMGERLRISAGSDDENACLLAALEEILH